MFLYSRVLPGFVLISGLICALSSCSGDAANFTKEEKFKVTDDLLNSLQVDTVQAANGLTEITLNGKISPDEDKMIRIFPMVSGVVQDVKVHSGDMVSKGQVLATMKSMEMAGFAFDAVTAETELKQAQKNLQVTEDMYRSGLASERELQEAKNGYQKAKAGITHSKAVMNINQAKDGLHYAIKAPISGFVVEKNLTNNTQIRSDNGGNAFTVADLSEVWVMANIYEADIAKVKVGDAVKITTISYPGKVFEGKIEKIYSTIDPENKVMKARIRVKNPGYLLKPEMYANVKVSSKMEQSLPVVNTSCLIFDNSKYYVVVVGGKDKVYIQPVDVERKVEDRAYIRSGLNPGDRLVASRQVYMYESLKN